MLDDHDVNDLLELYGYGVSFEIACFELDIENEDMIAEARKLWTQWENDRD